ncbi:MAG: acyloxyacyl hydrolase [Cryomorphaceae bacterium]|nr:acyloxyacyl hydrolase [Cryomorphaceae bacterium]
MSTFRPHRSEIHLSQRGFAHVDASLIYYTQGDKLWSANNKAPRVGLRYAYFAFPDEAMGQAHGLNAFLSKDFYRSDVFRWYWQMGFGLGYLTQTYDEVSNPRQVAISSNLNVYADARMGVAWHLRQQELHLGFLGFHFSNAANMLPNSGMNFIGTYLGWSPKVKVNKPEMAPQMPSKRYELLVGLNAWARQASPERPHDFVSNGYIEFNRRMTPNYQLGLGVNLFYEGYEKVYDRWASDWGDGGHPSYAWHELLASGVYVNNEWMMDRFSVYLHFGAYTHGHWNTLTAYADYGQGPYEHQIAFIRSDIFHRLGFRYRLTEHLTYNLSMLTHFFKARYTEMGVALRL